MPFPGQKKGSCGHIMALFNSKCARCREKSIGQDLARSVMTCLKIRRNSWPPLLTGHEKSSRRI